MPSVLAGSEMLSSRNSRHINPKKRRQERFEGPRAQLLSFQSIGLAVSRSATSPANPSFRSSRSRDSSFALRLSLRLISDSLITMLVTQVRNWESRRNCESFVKALRRGSLGYVFRIRLVADDR